MQVERVHRIGAEANSFVTSGPRKVRLPRQLRCDWKPGVTSETFCRVFAYAEATLRTRAGNRRIIR